LRYKNSLDLQLSYSKEVKKMKAIISLVLLAILSHSYGQSLGGNTVTGGLVSLEDFSEAEDLWNQYNGLLRNVNGKRENLR
jgi:hypothetical protein